MPSGWGFRRKPGLVAQEIHSISSATSELQGVCTVCNLVTEPFPTTYCLESFITFNGWHRPQIIYQIYLTYIQGQANQGFNLFSSKLTFVKTLAIQYKLKTETKEVLSCMNLEPWKL